MKMSKKFFLALPFSAVFLIACNNNSVNSLEHLQQKLIINDENHQWNQFLENEHINNLLNFVFDDKDEKELFIENQKSINSTIVLNDLKEALAYYNFVRAALDLSIWGSETVYRIEQSEKQIVDLIANKWLWFLFNINKFEFFFFPEMDRFNETEEEHNFSIKDKALSNGGFYYPPNNTFIDSAQMIYEDTTKSTEKLFSYNLEKLFFFMNENGMIFNLNVNKIYDKNKKIISKNVSLFPYILAFPKLLKSENKLKNFSLSKYIQTNSSFSDNNVNTSAVDRISFADYYDGEPLRYTIVGVNTKKIKKVEI